jgi:putative transposase
VLPLEGIAGMSKDAVSRLCRGLDEQVRIFRERPLEGRYPHLWLDGELERVRRPGTSGQKCLVIAYAVHETGRREVIGLAVGDAETESFWREFLRSLRARGLTGVRRCVSDRHEGRKAAIAPGARLPVAALHRALPHKHAGPLPEGPAADDLGRDPRHLLGRLGGRGSRAPGRGRRQARTDRAKDRAAARGRRVDLLAFYELPREHWSKLKSTSPLERVNREIGRRTDVVGIFPNDAAPIRLAGSLLVEQNDEWLVGRRYLSQQSLSLVLHDQDTDTHTIEDNKRSPSSTRPEPPPQPTIQRYTTKRDLTGGGWTTRANWHELLEWFPDEGACW